MVARLKALGRRVARRLAVVPVLGRLVRIGVAVIRLPETMAAQAELNLRHGPVDTPGPPPPPPPPSDAGGGDLQADLLASIPVALRALTREQASLRQRVAVLGDSTSFLAGRVEFVRRELMYELRHGASRPVPGAGSLETATRVVSPEKVAAAMASGPRLNLGCGHLPLDGYLNVDRRPLPGVDIVAEAEELPFEPGEVDEVFSAHLLEHFPHEHLRRKLLPYLYRLLKPGGLFRAVVPDADAMARGYADGSYGFEKLREVSFGAQDYDGDFHFTMFTPASMEEVLREAGFVDTAVLASGRRNGSCFEFEVTARKPAGPGPD